MAKKSSPQTEADSEFRSLVCDLKGFGWTQAKLAAHLGITPGQMSRVTNGERPIAKKNLRALRNLLESRNESSRPSRQLGMISLNKPVLSQMTDRDAVEAFRDLLWAHATQRGFPISNVSISSETDTADGGIDASVIHCGLDGDLLLSSGRRYQIKTGNAKPWQRSWIKKEILRSPSRGLTATLPSGVLRCLQERGEFVLICFGVDLIDEKRRGAEKNLREEFKLAGFPAATVQVWGQIELIGLFRVFPALCLQLLKLNVGQAQTHASWSGNDDMKTSLHYGAEQTAQLEELRTDLATGRVKHIRLLGEPGVGKTRFALEVTRDQNGDAHLKQGIAATTFYFANVPVYRESTAVITDLLQSEESRFAVLVIDECAARDRAEIWNRLKSHSDRLRLITIDHGPDKSVDDVTKVVVVQPADQESITKILVGYGKIPEYEAVRWARLCEGSPRVAHVLGQNLSSDRSSDLLAEPSICDVWKRFIEDKNVSPAEAAQAKTVLLCIGLFERFGFDDPVAEESEFIARIAQEIDPSITTDRFRLIVRKLKERRILQGATTLYITPRLLHVYLFREYWETFGHAKNLKRMLNETPADLRKWFVAMLRYAQQSPIAVNAVEKLFGPEGLFSEGSFADTNENGQLLAVFAESCPKGTLKCMKRLFGNLSTAERLQIVRSRYWLVRALEFIAVWDDCFLDAADLLLSFAEAENEQYANNSRATFATLFSLVPGFGATQASPAKRLIAVQDALDSSSYEKRMIGLQACRVALGGDKGFRTVGPEHQGLRKTIEFWAPKTYGELWGAHKQFLSLLTLRLVIWQGEERRRLIETIIAAAYHLIHIQTLSLPTLELLETLADDPQLDTKAMLGFLHRQLRFGKNLAEPIASRLRQLQVRFEGGDISSRLRRFVMHRTWHDDVDEAGAMTAAKSETTLDGLASELIAAPERLEAELSWLIHIDNGSCVYLGYAFGRQDRLRQFLERIINAYEQSTRSPVPGFFCGYLSAIALVDLREWEELMERLAARPTFRIRFSDYVIGSWMSDRAARCVIANCKSGNQDIERLERWWFSSRLRDLSEDVLIELLRLQIDSAKSHCWANAISMCHTFYSENQQFKPLPEALTFELLIFSVADDGNMKCEMGHYWTELAGAFCEQFPNRRLELFKALLSRSSERWRYQNQTEREQVLTRIFQEDPVGGWSIVKGALERCNPSDRYTILHWLTHGGNVSWKERETGPIVLIDRESLFAWIEEDVEARALLIARTLPKSLANDSPGRLTREFIARYGRELDVQSELAAHFSGIRWSGLLSEHLRTRRREAESWLVGEKNRNVVRWLEEYIEWLSRMIKSEEIREEREIR